jgi:Zn-dependent protease with chaperone function
VSWFLYGIGRQPTGAFVALLAGYTALIVSLWYAVLGMIFGVLVAIHVIHANSVTQDLFNAGAGTSVTAVAVATGALVGAGGGFVSFYTHTLASSPLQEGVGIVFGFLLSVAVVAVIAVFEGNLLALRGCRQLTVDEVRRISPMLQNLGTQYGLRNAPRFAIRQTRDMNAWAHMRHIVLTKGILDLDDNQLTAVIAHELHHWRSGDSVGQHVVWACAWPVVLLYNIASRFSNDGRGVEIPPTKAPGFIVFAVWLIAWPAWLLVKFPITLAVRRDMRAQEYEADAAVKQIGYGPALISALRTLSIFEGGRTGWETALYATHPTSDERIDRLQVRTAADMDHVEPPLGAETNSLVGLIWGLAIVFAAFIAWGAVLNANRSNTAAATSNTTTPSAPQGPLTAQQRDAERSAASFSTAYFDSVFSQPGYQQVIRQYGDPNAPHVLSYQADAGNPGVISTWAAGQPTTSKAQVVACGFESGTSANTAIAEVFVHWTFSVGGSSGSQWVDDAVPLTLVDSRWLADDLPTIPDISSGGYASTIQPEPPTPSGYGQCP